MIDYENQQARRRLIMRWLQQRNSLSVAELTARLAVSRMTIHRDIAYLVGEGIVTKRHGWVEWVAREPREARIGSSKSTERTRWDVILPNGQGRSACCPSCGLRHVSAFSDDVRIDVDDALTGRRIDGRRATYVVASRINLCCWPGVLAFEDAVDAVSFQRGFGGQVATFADARAALAGEPTSQSSRTTPSIGTRRTAAHHLAQHR